MGKVGRWVTDSRAGAYCTITFDSGEKIVINHDKGGFKGGRLTIVSDRIFDCDLDSQRGKTALGFSTREAEDRSVDATPRDAFVKYLKSSQSVGEVKTRCVSLMAIPER